MVELGAVLELENLPGGLQFVPVVLWVFVIRIVDGGKTGLDSRFERAERLVDEHLVGPLLLVLWDLEVFVANGPEKYDNVGQAFAVVNLPDELFGGVRAFE